MKLYPDNFVEVFGQNLDVHLQQILHMESTEGQRLAEDFADLQIPKRFLSINYPLYRAGIEQIRLVKPSDIYWRNIDLAIVEACHELGRPSRNVAPSSRTEVFVTCL